MSSSWFHTALKNGSQNPTAINANRSFMSGKTGSFSFFGSGMVLPMLDQRKKSVSSSSDWPLNSAAICSNVLADCVAFLVWNACVSAESLEKFLGGTRSCRQLGARCSHVVFSHVHVRRGYDVLQYDPHEANDMIYIPQHCLPTRHGPVLTAHTHTAKKLGPLPRTQ